VVVSQACNVLARITECSFSCWIIVCSLLRQICFSETGGWQRAYNIPMCPCSIGIFFESRILTCLTYTSRRGSQQHRGQTAEQEDTKARKAKLQRPRTAAQGSLSHKQQA
jgi:hypothetical protein